MAVRETRFTGFAAKSFAASFAAYFYGYYYNDAVIA